MPPQSPKQNFLWVGRLYAVGKGALPLIPLFLVVFAAALAANLVTTQVSNSVDSSGASTDTSSPTSLFGSSCNVVGIEVRGCIATFKPDSASGGSNPFSTDTCDTYTSSEEVVAAIESAKSEKQIKGIVLEIDSPGGEAVAAEEVSDALKAFGKPTVSWIRGYADSAAYWIASSADTVIASENSDVGSIGVTSSYVDNAKKNASDGLTYNQLIAGKYKDMFSTDRPLTSEERALIQRDLDIIHQNFIRTVAANRHLPVEKVQALADGSTMLGGMALSNGLIDKLGTKDVVWKTLEDAIGEKPDVCW